ncbi:NVEALA domain-containing protein [Parabacteroides sp.]|uniref:NVEALA domain-containing protein n=1 Tax=Parabacteroides sp. TaxID=1869337 RepID=UPI00259B0235|nr:NVEALA domain-containing protein [uncultured Parabacteroides sp.]
MKQILPKASIGVILLISSFYLVKENKMDVSDIALDNIEALAAGEGGIGKWHCLGSGSLDCPNGTKVEFIVENYSWD